MKTPVLFIIFNRYDTALRVFNEIKKAKPPRLYIAADAPRESVEGEYQECMKTREIVKLIDWECEIKTLFQTENQGCGVGPYKAISWFFENEEQGIILEDDCLPHPDFFTYCEEMLYRFKEDTSITLISGRNNFDYTPQNGDSYFLSALHFCWGWASWRRVWEKYDYTLRNINSWDYFRALKRYFGLSNIFTILWRMNIFYQCKNSQNKDYWDYQFCVITQLMHGYTIIPSKNLIRNIGTDSRATHTSGFEDTILVESILPLSHPQDLLYQKEFDITVSKKRFKKFKTTYYFILNLFK